MRFALSRSVTPSNTGVTLAYFASALSAFLGFPFLAYVPTVFFFRWSPNDTKKNRIAYFIIKTILYAIWTFRNRAAFYNSNETSSAIIKYAFQDISRRIRSDFFRLPPSRFSDLWASPSICAVDLGVLRIFLE